MNFTASSSDYHRKRIEVVVIVVVALESSVVADSL